jgi:hypothetical protein
MMRTVSDIREGYTMRWDTISGCTARDGGYLLDKQLFFVQRGFASPKFLENTARLITACFDQNVTRLSDELDAGGLAWDFIVAVFRGEDVNNVVSVCFMTYGRTDERQYFYVVDVCTDCGMTRRGLAKYLMNHGVYRLCCLILKDHESVYWKRILDFSPKLWLLLDVDVESSFRSIYHKLIKLYSGLGYRKEMPNIQIAPLEPWRRRWSWVVPSDPAVRTQMWLEVVQGQGQSTPLSDSVLSELRGCGGTVVG